MGGGGGCGMGGVGQGTSMKKARITGQTINILRTYLKATPEEMALGLVWYRNAMDEVTSRVRAAKRDGRIPRWVRAGRKKLAGVTACLSMKKSWQVNMNMVVQALAGEKVGHFGCQVVKAEAILGGADPLQVLQGMKERAFYLNLSGLDPNAVTVDRHALRIWAGRMIPEAELKISDGLYREIERDYREAAEAVGISASAIQAGTWAVERRLRNSMGHVQDMKARLGRGG
jgi:hypothetical protein